MPGKEASGGIKDGDCVEVRLQSREKSCLAHKHSREASVTYEASSSLHQQLLHLPSKQYITAKAKKQISRLV